MKVDMQGIGYILVNKEKILVLWRLNQRKHEFGVDNPGYVALKLRKSGQDGMFFETESQYLSENPKRLTELQQGIVVKL